MAETKELLQKSDIRTMRKDIRQLRKFSILKNQPLPAIKPAAVQEKVSQPVDTQKVIQQQREIIERVLEQSAKQRQLLEKEPSKAQAPISQMPIEKKQELAAAKPEAKWMNQMPEETKEKLQVMAHNEQEKRARFMEDVEKWAKES